MEKRKKRKKKSLYDKDRPITVVNIRQFLVKRVWKLVNETLSADTKKKKKEAPPKAAATAACRSVGPKRLLLSLFHYLYSCLHSTLSYHLPRRNRPHINFLIFNKKKSFELNSIINGRRKYTCRPPLTRHATRQHGILFVGPIILTLRDFLAHCTVAAVGGNL